MTFTERFWSKVDRRGPDECWKWCGPLPPECREELMTPVRRWEARTAAGIDPTHGGEATRKRGDAIARSNSLKPRKGYKRQRLGDDGSVDSNPTLTGTQY